MQQPEVQLTGAKSSSQKHSAPEIVCVCVCVWVRVTFSFTEGGGKKKHTKDEDGFGDICH